MTFMDIHNYIHLWILGRRSYLKNTHSLKNVSFVTLLGKPVMGFLVLAAQACINGTKKIKHFSDHQLLLPFPASTCSHTESHWGQIRGGLDKQIILGLTISPQTQETYIFNPVCVAVLCCHLIYHLISISLVPLCLSHLMSFCYSICLWQCHILVLFPQQKSSGAAGTFCMLHSLISARGGLSCPALGMPGKALGRSSAAVPKLPPPPCSDTANTLSVLQSPTDDSKLRQIRKQSCTSQLAIWAFCCLL